MRLAISCAPLALAALGCNALLANDPFAGPDLGDADARRLDSLAITAGTLDPPFSPVHLEYTVELGFAITHQRVIATAPGRALSVAGGALESGALSAPIELTGAQTEIEVAVADGFTYTLRVERTAAIAPDRLFKPPGTEGSETSISTPDNHLLYGDAVGFAVALDDHTLVIGAPGSDDGVADDTARSCGALYVYRRSDGDWRFDAVLRAPAPAAEELLGFAVAVDRDVIVAGGYARDAAYVWERGDGGWAPPVRLVAPRAAAGDGFGYAVAVDGDLVVVGAPLEDGAGAGVDPPADERAPAAGAAYVFRRGAAGWQPAAYLKAANPGADDWFGAAVAVEAGTIAIGAPQEDSAAPGTPDDDSLLDAGAIYVFTPAGAGWAGPRYVKAARPEYGDGVGSALALDGELIVAGAPTLRSREGRAVVFRERGSGWAEVAAFAGFPASNFGATVAAASGTIVVGAPNFDNCNGRAFVYRPTATGWAAAIELADIVGCELFGRAVAVASDGSIAVGGYEDSRLNRGILAPTNVAVTTDGGSGVVLLAR